MNFFDTTITKAAIHGVERCLLSEHVSEGNLVRDFETSLEGKLGMTNVVAVNSGTSALHLALVLAGVKEGDEVILPAQTFIATGMAVLYCKATPVFADISMDGNLDIHDTLSKITDKTKAIICVSWGGNPCKVDFLSALCDENGISLIQDNAQALGATYEMKDLSGYGDFSCYSFQATKHLTTGDGGAIACVSEKDYHKAKNLRWFGIDREYDLADVTGERHYNLKDVGFKYHMSDYSAALGLGNLLGLENRLNDVRKIASLYHENMQEISTIKKAGCSYWLYDLLVGRRTDFQRAMMDRGIPTSVVHMGIDRNDIFGGKKDLPNQRFWDEHHVCIPIHPNLVDEDVQHVIESVEKGW